MQGLQLVRVKRRFEPPQVSDAEGLARAQAALLLPPAPAPGARLALAVGSRGLDRLNELARGTLAAARDAGWTPFVVAAMGSHGGATAEGQRAVLERLGLSAEAVGAELADGGDWQPLGHSTLGNPLSAPRCVLEARGLLLLNRVKAHTAFVGSIASGLLKQLAVGLGGPQAADSAHRLGLAVGLETVIRDAAVALAQRLPLLGGLALVENALGRLALVEGLGPDQLAAGEERLLLEAKRLAPRLPLSELDLLVVDRMGKDISGTGMDPWLIGRMYATGEPEPETPRIRRIYVRSLSLAAGGNAHGVGLADFVHRRLERAIDWQVTRRNALTARAPQKARLPLVMESDREALETAVASAGVEPASVRLAWIRDTLSVERLWLSPAALERAYAEPGLEIEEQLELAWDTSGDLPL